MKKQDQFKPVLKPKLFINFNDIETKLIQDKTTIQMNSDDDENVIVELCSQPLSQMEIKNYEESLKAVQKFLKDLFSKIKVNSFHLTFEELRIRSCRTSSFLWPDDGIDVLLGLKKPMGVKFKSITEEYVMIELPGEQKLKADSFDVYEHLRLINNKSSLMSSVKYHELCEKILKDSFLNLLESLKDVVTLLELTTGSDGCVVVVLEFCQLYMEKPEREPRRSSSVSSTIIKLKFIPALSINSKQKIYFITLKPNLEIPRENDNEIFPHLWYQDSWWKEYQLLEKVSAADRHIRLRAFRGVYFLLTHNPSTDFLNKYHCIHSLIQLINQELDTPIIKWQRKSVAASFLDQLKQIKCHLERKQLGNFFVNNTNLFDKSISNIQFQSAANSIGILLNSRSKMKETLENIMKNV